MSGTLEMKTPEPTDGNSFSFLKIVKYEIYGNKITDLTESHLLRNYSLINVLKC